MTLTSRRRILTRAKMLDFLGELEKAASGEAYSLYLPPGLPPAETEISLKQIPVQPDILPELTGLVNISKTGAVLFSCPQPVYLVMPPFPIVEKRSTHQLYPEPLRSLLRHDYKIALVLVRLGAYSIGVCDGEKLLSSKVGTGLIHQRHKKGGSSQQRFARHREKQIEYFLTRVCQRALEHLQPHERILDYIVYGGAWTTIQLLKKHCPLLGQFDERALPPLLDIPEPRQAVLISAVSRVWSSTLIEWVED